MIAKNERLKILRERLKMIQLGILKLIVHTPFSTTQWANYMWELLEAEESIVEQIKLLERT